MFAKAIWRIECKPIKSTQRLSSIVIRRISSCAYRFQSLRGAGKWSVVTRYVPTVVSPRVLPAADLPERRRLSRGSNGRPRTGYSGQPGMSDRSRAEFRPYEFVIRILPCHLFWGVTGARVRDFGACMLRVGYIPVCGHRFARRVGKKPGREPSGAAGTGAWIPSYGRGQRAG